LFIKAAGFGAGFAVAIALLIGAAYWWAERPTRQKPWNKNAIKAKYSDLIIARGDKTVLVTFAYAFENTSDFDYRLSNSVRMLQKDERNISEEMVPQWTPVDWLVPAHQVGRDES
jgi:hypothetical protein